MGNLASQRSCSHFPSNLGFREVFKYRGVNREIGLHTECGSRFFRLVTS